MGKIAIVLFLTLIGTFVFRVINYPNPNGSLSAILFGGSLGGLLFIIGPMWLGKIMYKSMGGVEVKIKNSTVDLKDYTDNQLVELIDKVLNSAPIVANHPWLANNWHNLNLNQKTEKVAFRRNILKTKLNGHIFPLKILNTLQEMEHEKAS